MLEAVRTTAEWTTAKIQAIRELLDETASAIRRKLPKTYSRELVELIFVNPYCRVNDVVKVGICQRQTATVYLNTLADGAFLEKVKAGKPLHQPAAVSAFVGSHLNSGTGGRKFKV